MVQTANNNRNKASNPFKIFSIILILLFFGIVISFSVLSILSPIKKVKEINNKYKDDNADENYLDALTNQHLFQLKKDEAFLRARLLMSENDSINLSINIPDSVISIEIKGTNIYSVPIKRIVVSKVFNQIDKDAFINYISSPFCILQEKATIPKEPLIIKKAPKDTAEANRNITQPDTLGPKIVAYRFYTDKYLIINIKQFEDVNFISSFLFQFDNNLQISKMHLKKLIKFEIPDYIPWIQLEMNKNEAIALFRALPEHAFISIQF
jgi:hypothetical protein